LTHTPTPMTPPPPRSAWARARAWAPLALMLAAGASVWLSGAHRHLSLENMRASHAAVQDFVAAHFWLGLGAYMALFAATTFVAVPGAMVLQLAAGFLFGPWIGGAATAVAATIGSLGYYWGARSALGEALRLKAYADPRARRWREGLEKDAFWYLLSLRIPPVVLFVVVSALAGLAAVRLRTYLTATLIGVWPSATVYAFVGHGLRGALERGEAIELVSGPVLWPLAGLTVLSLIPAGVNLVRRLRRRGPETPA